MRRLMVIAAVAVLVAGCSTDEPAPGASVGHSTVPAPVDQRLDAIQAAIDQWGSAATIEEAHGAAEAVRNLVVGPDGPYYGDADGDGTIQGENSIGLLPDYSGEPGLVVIDGSNPCVIRDVLGGAWSSPQRWEDAIAAYDAWTPANNTMPTLASHPQRIVGWATFTLATDDLDAAHEYAGHAQLHVDVTRRAYLECSG